MANTYIDEPFIPSDCPVNPDIGIGCNDCGWTDLAATIEDAQWAIKRHECKEKK